MDNKKYIPVNEMVCSQYSEVLKEQLNKNSQMKQSSNKDLAIYQNNKTRIYIHSPSGEISYTSVKQTSECVNDGIKQSLENIRDNPSKDRYCIPYREIRSGSQVGHYVVLVLDKNKNGEFEATVYDSKSNSSFLSLLINFFKTIFFIPKNGDQALQCTLSDIFKTPITVKRKHYGHQATRDNYLSPAFSLRLLENTELLEGRSPNIPKPNRLFGNSTSFLTEENLSQYEDKFKEIQDKELALLSKSLFDADNLFESIEKEKDDLELDLDNLNNRFESSSPISTSGDSETFDKESTSRKESF